MSVKPKKKQQKSISRLFPSSKAYMSSELRETYFDELFAEDSILTNRLRSVKDQIDDPEEERKERLKAGLKACRVTRKYEREASELYRLCFVCVDTYESVEIEGTPEHPFWVALPCGPDGKGRWVPIKNLEIGCKCISGDGTYMQLIGKEHIKLDKPIKVYNLEVEGGHTYFVGKDGKGVLVHNQCGPSNFIDGNPIGWQKNISGIDLSATVYFVFRNDPQDYKGVDGVVDLLSRFKVPNIYPDMGNASTIIKKEAGVHGNGHGIYDSSPTSPEYVGTWGFGPCIAVLIYSPSTGQRTTFHFTQQDIAGATLRKHYYPPDSVAIIGGASGGNLTTRNQMRDVLSFLREAGIEVQGYVPGDDAEGIYVNRSGSWIVVPSPQYIDFMNKPPTLQPTTP